MRTRAEHMAWCKARALEYVDEGHLAAAVSSMLSDLNKHPDTKDGSTAMALLGLFAVLSKSSVDVRKFIEGFQ